MTLSNDRDKCGYCQKYKAIFWNDVENNTFVYGNEMLATVNGRSIRFKVKYCPMCSRKLCED